MMINHSASAHSLECSILDIAILQNGTPPSILGSLLSSSLSKFFTHFPHHVQNSNNNHDMLVRKIIPMIRLLSAGLWIIHLPNSRHFFHTFSTSCAKQQQQPWHVGQKNNSNDKAIMCWSVDHPLAKQQTIP